MVDRTEVPQQPEEFDRKAYRKAYYWDNRFHEISSNARYYHQNKRTLRGRIRVLLNNARRRADIKGLDWDISSVFVREKAIAQGEKCIYTGIDFDYSNPKSPYAMSLDRKDPNKGYTEDNVQLVSRIYNNTKNIYSHTDVIKFAKEILAFSDNIE